MITNIEITALCVIYMIIISFSWFLTNDKFSSLMNTKLLPNNLKKTYLELDYLIKKTDHSSLEDIRYCCYQQPNLSIIGVRGKDSAVWRMWRERSNNSRIQMTIQIPTQGSCSTRIKTYKITLVLSSLLHNNAGCKSHFLLRGLTYHRVSCIKT